MRAMQKDAIIPSFESMATHIHPSLEL